MAGRSLNFWTNIHLSSSGRALSLLSSRNDSSISSPDLSSRCSAALRELIAENRAALLAKQFVFDKDLPFHHAEDVNVQQNNHSSHHHYHHHPLVSTNESHMFSEPQGWDRFDEPGTNNVTLDLMQAPTSAFELLSMRGKSKEDEECSQLWSSFSWILVIWSYIWNLSPVLVILVISIFYQNNCIFGN